MNRTIKQLPKSKPAYEVLGDLPIGARVVLRHLITDELLYGVVIGWPEDDPTGCIVRRVDLHWNKYALPALELDDDDYEVVNAVF